jgi:hypothetical protein
MRKSVVELLDRPAPELTSHQAFKTDQKILALWAADCAERVLPYFENEHPEDSRPRSAIETLREWVATGVFKMAVIRKASLDAHAAAREAEEGSAAQSAARAAGQAVATAHVRTHSTGAPAYALKAIAAADPTNAETNVVKERDWQLRRLRKYAHGSS